MHQATSPWAQSILLPLDVRRQGWALLRGLRLRHRDLVPSQPADPPGDLGQRRGHHLRHGPQPHGAPRLDHHHLRHPLELGDRGGQRPRCPPVDHTAWSPPAATSPAACSPPTSTTRWAASPGPIRPPATAPGSSTPTPAPPPPRRSPTSTPASAPTAARPGHHRRRGEGLVRRSGQGLEGGEAPPLELLEHARDAL
jgi:hypothetical protein